MPSKTLRTVTMSLATAGIVIALTSVAEARSPRGWVHHHLGGIEKEMAHAEKSLSSGKKKLKEIEKSLANGRKQISDVSSQLNDSNKQLDKAIDDNNQAHSSCLQMGKTLEGLPAQTPKKSTLVSQNNQQCKKLAEINVSLHKTKASIEKGGKNLESIDGQLKTGISQAKETEPKLSNAHEKIKGPLKTVKNMLKINNEWMPNIPHIKALK